ATCGEGSDPFLCKAGQHPVKQRTSMPDLNESDSLAPASGRTRGPLRLMSVISIISSCVLLSCAGCCFLIMFLFRPQTVDTAAGVDEVAARITDWAVPPGFTGKSAAIVDNAL